MLRPACFQYLIWRCRYLKLVWCLVACFLFSQLFFWVALWSLMVVMVVVKSCGGTKAVLLLLLILSCRPPLWMLWWIMHEKPQATIQHLPGNGFISLSWEQLLQLLLLEHHIANSDAAQWFEFLKNKILESCRRHIPKKYITINNPSLINKWCQAVHRKTSESLWWKKEEQHWRNQCWILHC